MTGPALHCETVPSPIGAVLVLSDGRGRVRAVDFEDRRERMLRLLRLHYGPSPSIVSAAGGLPSEARRALAAYFAGDLSAIDGLEVETGGTPFQREVWAALRRIPHGQAVSYGALAAWLGRPRAVRAVGLANGANPVSIIVPCHRVIGADGDLRGYGGGLSRKSWLLRHEGAVRKCGGSRRPVP